MALAYELIRNQKEARPVDEIIRVDQHWYLTEDRSQVVAEGVVGGRFLWAAPGQEVSRADAERLGAVAKPEEPEDAAAEASSETESKQRRAPANKQRGRAEDK